MVKLKTDQEIAIMAAGGKILRKAYGELEKEVKPGVTTEELDKKAESLIIKYGGEASFKKVKNYQWATCLPVNDQIVHTPPSSRIIKEKDILTVDMGVYYRGYHTDYAKSLVVGGKKDKKIDQFLKSGEEALEKAIQQAKEGNYIGHISQTIGDVIGKNGYFVIKELTGHGIGRDLHEDPMIPGFLNNPIPQTAKLRKGMVIAIEVIYSMGTSKMKYEKNDHWSLVTADESLSACFEHTVAIKGNKPFILT